jgi:hypothetical protein
VCGWVRFPLRSGAHRLCLCLFLSLSVSRFGAPLLRRVGVERGGEGSGERNGTRVGSKAAERGRRVGTTVKVGFAKFRRGLDASMGCVYKGRVVDTE